MKRHELLLAEAESLTTTSAGNSPPAPATAEPAAPAASDAAPAKAEAVDDWADLASDADDAPPPAMKPAPAPAARAEPAKTVATPTPAQPAVAPAPQPVAPTPPVAKTPETPPATPAPQAVTPQAPAEAPEVRAAREKAERETTEKKLHTDLEAYYKIPDDWSARLATEPELVLPQLAAKLHLAVMEGVQRLLANEMPKTVQGMIAVNQREAEAKGAFYGRWPELKKHEQQVLQAGMLFNQLNPTASPEERIEKIGRIVSESLGIPIAGTVPQPQTPPAPTPPAPFKPAGGASGARGPGPTPSNEFEAIAEEMARTGE